MTISARNLLEGTVREVREGPVDSRVRVGIGGGDVVTSMITTDAAKDLGVAGGRELHVIVKASEAMLATG